MHESPQRVNVSYELLGHIAFSNYAILRFICIMRLEMIVTKTQLAWALSKCDAQEHFLRDSQKFLLSFSYYAILIFICMMRLEMFVTKT